MPPLAYDVFPFPLLVTQPSVVSHCTTWRKQFGRNTPVNSPAKTAIGDRECHVVDGYDTLRPGLNRRNTGCPVAGVEQWSRYRWLSCYFQNSVHTVLPQSLWPSVCSEVVHYSDSPVSYGETTLDKGPIRRSGQSSINRKRQGVPLRMKLVNVPPGMECFPSVLPTERT